MRIKFDNRYTIVIFETRAPLSEDDRFSYYTEHVDANNNFTFSDVQQGFLSADHAEQDARRCLELCGPLPDKPKPEPPQPKPPKHPDLHEHHCCYGHGYIECINPRCFRNRAENPWSVKPINCPECGELTEKRIWMGYQPRAMKLIPPPKPGGDEPPTIQTITAKGRFPLGRVVATRGALEAFAESCQDTIEFINRHHSGDWGDLSEADKQENEFSIDKHLRIFSAYHTNKGEKLWIITEADRSATTILLPSEY